LLSSNGEKNVAEKNAKGAEKGLCFIIKKQAKQQNRRGKKRREGS